MSNRIKIYRNIMMLLSILVLGMQSPHQVGGSITTSGFTVTIELSSAYVINDCDTLNDGDWHFFIQDNAGNNLYPTANNIELTIASGATVTLNYKANSTISGNTYFRLYAADNDGATTALTIPDCESVFSILISTTTRNQWTTSTYVQNADVRLYYRYYITDLQPQVNTSLNTINLKYGQTLTFPELALSDEQAILNCEYDFDYDGITFTSDYSASSICGQFSLAPTDLAYPSNPFPATYAVRLKDSAGQYSSIYTSTLNFSNTAPVLGVTALNSNYATNQDIIINWSVNDLNPDTYQIYANGSLISQGNYDVNGTSVFSNHATINIANEGYYTISLHVNDTNGVEVTDSQTIQVLQPALSGLSIISPTLNQDVVEEMIIQWTAATDNFGNTVTYDIDYSSDNGTNYNSIITSLNTTSYTWNVTQFARGLEYKIMVTANSISGTMSEVSSKFNLREVHKLGEISITSPSETDTLAGNITVSWETPTDNWNHSISYNIYFTQDDLTWTELTLNLTGNQVIWNTEMVDDGSYKVKITASDGIDTVEYISGTYIIMNKAEITSSPQDTSTSLEVSNTTQTPDSNVSTSDPNLNLPGFDFSISILSIFTVISLVKKHKKISKY